MDMSFAHFCYAFGTVSRSDRAAAWERQLRQIDELNDSWVFRGIAVLVKGSARLIAAAHRILLRLVRVSPVPSH